MAVDESLIIEMTHASAHNLHAELRHVGAMCSDWDSLPAMHRFALIEHAAERLKPVFPIVDRALEHERVTSMEHAAVLRARVEMFIEDVKARGGPGALLAAELEQIINEDMED